MGGECIVASLMIIWRISVLAPLPFCPIDSILSKVFIFLFCPIDSHRFSVIICIALIRDRQTEMKCAKTNNYHFALVLMGSTVLVCVVCEVIKCSADLCFVFRSLYNKRKFCLVGRPLLVTQNTFYYIENYLWTSSCLVLHHQNTRRIICFIAFIWCSVYFPLMVPGHTRLYKLMP